MEQIDVMGPAGMRRPGGRGLIVLRGLLIGLGAVLGIVLLWTGYVVIGAILLTMAVLRVVMLVQMRRRRAWRMERRQQFAARMRQRRGFGPGGPPQAYE